MNEAEAVQKTVLLIVFIPALCVVVAMWIAAFVDHRNRQTSIAHGTYHDFVLNEDGYSYRCCSCGKSWSAINPNEYLGVPVICAAKHSA